MKKILNLLLIFCFPGFIGFTFAIANPASVKCIDDGGSLSLTGSVGMCTFPSGQVCEEWAYFRGECVLDKPILIGGDKDAYGCLISAGYLWSPSKQKCVRSREESFTPIEKAYDFAFHNGLTTMSSLTLFRPDDKITGQEAAKMFVSMAKNVFANTGSSYTTCEKYLDDAKFDPTLRDFIYSSCKLGLMKGSMGYFYPHGILSRAQALAVIMRNADQKQDETSNPRWLEYYKRASALGYLPTGDLYNNFEKAITRGEMIELIYNIYQKKNSK